MTVLLIDTCGEGARVAVSRNEDVVARREMDRGAGSAEIVDAIAAMLQECSLAMAELDAVGVVSGPGSFTGVRVGMATAKGLCEGSGVRMVAVSRLRVLWEAAKLQDGMAALDAGRGQLYVGESDVEGEWREWLGSVGAVVEALRGRRVVVAETKVHELLAGSDVELRDMTMEDVLAVVLASMQDGREDDVLADGNYVRRESDIYAKPVAVR